MSVIADLLKSSPSYDELTKALQQWLQEPAIARLSVQDASVAHAIVNDILPHYWPLALEDTSLRCLLCESLASLAGINALLSARNHVHAIETLQEVCNSSSLSPAAVYTAWFMNTCQKETSKKSEAQLLQLWSQYTSLFAGGKILNATAEAVANQKSKDLEDRIWLSARRSYVQFLGRQLSESIKCQGQFNNASYLQRQSEYFNRALFLGDSSVFVEAILNQIESSESCVVFFGSLLSQCTSSARVRVTAELLKHYEQKYLQIRDERMSSKGFASNADRVGAVAKSFSHLFTPKVRSSLESVLLEQDYLANISIRRAIVLVLKQHDLTHIVAKLLSRWADSMYIKHTSVVLQEHLTESLLLLCSYLPIEPLTTISKSEDFTIGISAHLESTSERIRFLGMVLGEAISAQVVSDEKKRLVFGVPDTQTAEAKWWKSLIEVHDEFNDLSSLHAGLVEQPEEPKTTVGDKTGHDEIKINELIDGELHESSEDEEFAPMRVPDSDDEDSDEDPTLIDREKVPPPVYIRDLIKLLNKHESYKHASVALATGASLIRRKSRFGTELEDYAINLVQLLAGLRDNFDMDNFQELRLENLKALVVSCPKIVCPYLAQLFFTGDYSLQQKVIILAAIGLGSQELADIVEIAAEFQSLNVSKVLPQSVAEHYKLMADMTHVVQEEILRPMAVEAAESLSGPDALKVHSTRRKTTPIKSRAIVANKATPIVAESIMFPLLGNFQIYGGKMIDPDASTFYEASLLAYFIRTLTLVYRTASASSSFSQVTREFWNFLLALRTQTDHAVLEALCFATLLIIDCNDDRVLASQFARLLVETQDWASMKYERVSEEKIRMILAGILIRIRGIIESHQMLIMGDVMSVGNIGRGRLGIAGLS